MLSTAEIIVIAFVAGGLFGIVLTAFFRALERQKTPVLRDILIKMKQNPVFTKEETDIIMEIYDDIRKKYEQKKKGSKSSKWYFKKSAYSSSFFLVRI